MEYWIFRLPPSSECLMLWNGDFRYSRNDYVLVYVGEIEYSENILEKIYEKLNIDHPADYRIPSLSVGDVVMLRKDSGVEYYYVDLIGFKRVWEELK